MRLPRMLILLLVLLAGMVMGKTQRVESMEAIGVELQEQERGGKRVQNDTRLPSPVGKKKGMPAEEKGREKERAKEGGKPKGNKSVRAWSAPSQENSPLSVLSESEEQANLRRPKQRQLSAPPAPIKKTNDFHFPYRPKYPAFPHFGMCNFEDFEFSRGDRVGRGGFGKVYKAVHRPTGMTVAIKLIETASIRKNPKHVELEETIHHCLHHPYISLHYCTIRTADSDVLLVSQFFSGGNLSRQLTTMHPLPRHIMVKYTAQVLVALRYLHLQCIAYRDIKAENIMLDHHDNIRMIDFGLAVNDCDNRQTGVAGTLEYMAPEVAKGGPYGRAADYYSLGILVYLLYKGSMPYRTRDYGDRKKMLKALTTGITIPSTGNGIVDGLITLLTDKDQKRRWTNIYENFAQLKRHDYFSGLEWADIESPTTCCKQYPSMNSLNPKGARGIKG